MTDDCATVGYGIVSLILIMVESSHWYTRSSAIYYTIFCTPLETATWIPASPVLRKTYRYKSLPHRIQCVFERRSAQKTEFHVVRCFAQRN